MIIGFISLGCLLIGIGGVFFILARKAKSLSDDDVKRLVQSAAWYRRLDVWWREHVQAALESGTFEQQLSLSAEKFLRGIHVILLRADNRLHGMIQHVRERREERLVDREYWTTVQDAALGRKIDKLFRDIRKNHHRDTFDPIKEEHSLTDEKINNPERWFNLIRFYLAKGHTSEARRVLVNYWLQNKGDENIFLILQGILLKEKNISGQDLSSSQDSETDL